LYKLATWFALLSGGCSAKMAWPTRGSEKGTLRLVFYTDVHARLEWETPTALKKAAAAINANKPDLVIAGGDLITDGFQNPASVAVPRWNAYMEMHREIKGDLFPAIGNHDLVAANPADGSVPAQDPRAIFLAQMGLDRTYYSFDAVGYHFIVLDTIQVSGDQYQYHGIVAADQIEWLKDDLKHVSPNTPIVITTHIPLLSAFYAASRGATFAAPKDRVVVNNVEVLDLFKDHNLLLVLQGHLHVKELIRWRGTTFITGGAICGKWWRGPWFDTNEGFNIITLAGDRVEWEYIDYGWQARRPKSQ
jgi:3',5'-cyclic AMP phosphodiesterase CpdA